MPRIPTADEQKPLTDSVHLWLLGKVGIAKRFPRAFYARLFYSFGPPIGFTFLPSPRVARESNFPKVSNIQAYLDLYAQGGRDLKQADVLLDAAIAPRWKSV